MLFFNSNGIISCNLVNGEFISQYLHNDAINHLYNLFS